MDQTAPKESNIAGDTETLAEEPSDDNKPTRFRLLPSDDSIIGTTMIINGGPVYVIFIPDEDVPPVEDAAEHHPSTSTGNHQVTNESGPQDGSTSLLLSNVSRVQSDPQWSESDKLFGENFMKERQRQWEVTKMRWAKESAGKSLKLLKK